MKQATDRGFVAILATSDPAFGFVAPFGGREPLLTPNPFAIGYPGSRSPVLVDISASITTVSMIRQKAAAGAPLEHPWLHGRRRATHHGPPRARADRSARAAFCCSAASSTGTRASASP